MASALRILALDPATRTGYAHTSGERGEWDLRGAAGEHVGRRLLRLRDRVSELVDALGASVIAYEDAAFGGHHMRGHLFAGELRAVIKMVAAEVDAELLSYVPSSIKKFATGYGKADKQQMRRAYQTYFGELPGSDNIADALWVLEMAKQGYEPETTKKKRARSTRKRTNQLF